MNFWNSNYWDDYNGFGTKVLTGKNALPWNPEKTITWKYFDWHPAQEPYDIPR